MTSSEVIAGLVDSLVWTVRSYDMARACIGALGELGDVRAVRDSHSLICFSRVVVYLPNHVFMKYCTQVQEMIRFSRVEDFVTQQILAHALGNLPCPQSERALEFLRKEDHPNVRVAAEKSLEQLEQLMAARLRRAKGNS